MLQVEKMNFGKIPLQQQVLCIHKCTCIVVIESQFRLVCTEGLIKMHMDGFKVCVCFLQHPVTTYGYAFFFSLMGYFGISFVLALIKLFGAVVAVTGENCQSALF